MNTLNTIPLNILSDHHRDILALANSGPVTLVEKEQVAGILLSPAHWEAIAKTLKAAQECLAAQDASTRRRFQQ